MNDKDDDKKGKQDGNVFNVSSTNQSGGVTAGQVNNYGYQQRVLEGPISNEKLAKIKGELSGPIEVNMINADGEASVFADEIFRTMKDPIGWPVTMLNRCQRAGAPVRGVHVYSMAAPDDADDPLRHFAEWMQERGFQVTYSPGAKANKIDVGVQ